MVGKQARDTYACCRVVAYSGRYSLLKRKYKDPKDPLPLPSNLRLFAAYRPSGSLLLGLSGSGFIV